MPLRPAKRLFLRRDGIFIARKVPPRSPDSGTAPSGRKQTGVRFCARRFVPLDTPGLGNVQVNLTLPSLIRTFAAQFATTYDFNRRPHRRVQRHDAFQRHLLHDRRQGPDRPDGQKRSGQIDPAEDHRRSAFGHAGARDRGRRRESGVSAPAPSGGGRAHARRGGVAGLRTPGSKSSGGSRRSTSSSRPAPTTKASRTCG